MSASKNFYALWQFTHEAFDVLKKRNIADEITKLPYRLVYLAVKELSSLADDVIIVTSSLTKDMTGREDIYRAAAIRVLCHITDTGMLQTIERYMKQVRAPLRFFIWSE